MADKKISALTASTTPLAGTEVLPIVQGGATVKVAVSNLTAGRAVSALNLSLGTTGYGDGDYFGIANTNPSGYGNRLVVGNYSDVSATLNGSQFATNKAILTSWADGATNGAGATISVGWANGGQGPLKLAINGTTALQVEATRDVTVSTGNLVQGTAAKGINFTANTPLAGKTSQLLNWYEEGTWTPTLLMTSGSVTYSSRDARYTRVGNVVTVNTWILLSAISSPTGALSLRLPFTLGAAATRPACFVLANNLTLVVGQVAGWMYQSDNILYLVVSNNGSFASLAGTNLASNSELYISMTYNIG